MSAQARQGGWQGRQFNICAHFILNIYVSATDRTNNHNMTFISLLNLHNKTSYTNEEINRTEPSPSVSIPCFYYKKQLPPPNLPIWQQPFERPLTFPFSRILMLQNR